MPATAPKTHAALLAKLLLCSLPFALSIHALSADPPAAGALSGPQGVCEDKAGNLYVADTRNNRICKIAPDGASTVFAGTGVRGFADGGAAAAQFATPMAICIGPAENLIVADTGNQRIRKIDHNGSVSTIAGGALGFADGAGTAARFNLPMGICVGDGGFVYVADSGNLRIRKITRAGVVSTVAGGSYGNADGSGSAAQFAQPVGICIDHEKNMFVTSFGSTGIRKVTTQGAVSTLSLTWAPGAGAPTGAVQFSAPTGICADGRGSLYVSDTGNKRICKVSADGAVSVLAANPTSRPASPTNPQDLNQPMGISARGRRNAVHVADAGYNRVVAFPVR